MGVYFWQNSDLEYYMTRLTLLALACFTSLFSQEVLIVGIAGGTGSGKTTLAERIHKSFPDAVLISQDAYYKDQSDKPFEERGKRNFDHPDAIDFALLETHLNTLKSGNCVETPTYSFVTHTRLPETKEICPAKIILVEGILLFAVPSILELCDIKLFVDTDDDVRLLRRIKRDINDRGRTLESATQQYLKTVKPMHEAFVEPSKRFADIIIPQGGRNEVAIRLILARLQGHQ